MLKTILLTAWLGCQGLDGGTTGYALASGRFVEANPFMKHQTMTLKVGVNVTTLWAYWKVKDTRARNVIAGAMAGAGCVPGVMNLRTIARTQ